MIHRRVNLIESEELESKMLDTCEARKVAPSDQNSERLLEACPTSKGQFDHRIKLVLRIKTSPAGPTPQPRATSVRHLFVVHDERWKQRNRLGFTQYDKNPKPSKLFSSINNNKCHVLLFKYQFNFL